jgi:endoglucanase
MSPSPSPRTVRVLDYGRAHGRFVHCDGHDGSATSKAGTPGFVVNYEEGGDFPPAKEELFRFVASQGIDAVRIMVMWGEQVDMRTMEIRKHYFDRLNEVVDYIINSGMYCILSFYTDPSSNNDRENWLCADYQNYELISWRFKEIWKQVANHFKNYGPLLVFDSFNELVDAQCRWENMPAESYEALNRLTQDFVDAIRETGGNNVYRNLLVSIYSGQGCIEKSFEAFEFPRDWTSEKHIGVSHHLYHIDDTYKCLTDERSKPAIDWGVHLLNKYFISKDIPVVLGEFGMCPLTVADVSIEERCRYYSYLLDKTSEYGISALAWDDVADSMDRYYCRLSSPTCFQTMKDHAPVSHRKQWNTSGR